MLTCLPCEAVPKDKMREYHTYDEGMHEELRRRIAEYYEAMGRKKEGERDIDSIFRTFTIHLQHQAK